MRTHICVGEDHLWGVWNLVDAPTTISKDWIDFLFFLFLMMMLLLLMLMMMLLMLMLLMLMLMLILMLMEKSDVSLVFLLHRKDR